MLNYRGNKVRALPATAGEDEGVYVVGRWNGGSSTYESLKPITWPGGVVPDDSSRIIQLLGVVPLSGTFDVGKVSLYSRFNVACARCVYCGFTCCCWPQWMAPSMQAAMPLETTRFPSSKGAGQVPHLSCRSYRCGTLLVDVTTRAGACTRTCHALLPMHSTR